MPLEPVCGAGVQEAVSRFLSPRESPLSLSSLDEPHVAMPQPAGFGEAPVQVMVIRVGAPDGVFRVVLCARW